MGCLACVGSYTLQMKSIAVIEDQEFAEAVYKYLDSAANGARLDDQPELEMEASEMQQAIRALGQIHRVCAAMQDDRVLSLAGLELLEVHGPDGRLKTMFRYKVHGVYNEAAS